MNRFDALRADTDVFTTFEGDNTILPATRREGLLTDYRDAFGDLDQFGMVRFVASVAVETVMERTSVHRSSTGFATWCPPTTRTPTRTRGCSTPPRT